MQCSQHVPLFHCTTSACTSAILVHLNLRVIFFTSGCRSSPSSGSFISTIDSRNRSLHCHILHMCCCCCCCFHLCAYLLLHFCLCCWFRNCFLSMSVFCSCTHPSVQGYFLSTVPDTPLCLEFAEAIKGVVVKI